MALVMGLTPQGGQAQSLGQADGLSMPDVPVVTISPDLLFAGTIFGQRLAREIEARGTKLAAENRSIEAELAEEESELTGQRATMSAVDFRELADAFDKKVTEARAEQDEKARVLAATSDLVQRGYLQAIAPILEAMMNELGASVVLDRRAVFLSVDASDITQDAVARIDAEFKEGFSLEEVIAAMGSDPAPKNPAQEGEAVAPKN